MSDPEIHNFKLETTSTLTPGDIKAIMNRVKGYMRYSLICGCLSHSTTPPKDAARGAPEPGSVDKTKAPGEPTDLEEQLEQLFNLLPEKCKPCECNHLALPEDNGWYYGCELKERGELCYLEPGDYKEQRTEAEPAPELATEAQYQEDPR